MLVWFLLCGLNWVGEIVFSRSGPRADQIAHREAMAAKTSAAATTDEHDIDSNFPRES